MGSPIPVTISGRTIHVCCEACVASVKKNPAKYFAKVAQELKPFSNREEMSRTGSFTPRDQALHSSFARLQAKSLAPWDHRFQLRFQADDTSLLRSLRCRCQKRSSQILWNCATREEFHPDASSIGSSDARWSSAIRIAGCGDQSERTLAALPPHHTLAYQPLMRHSRSRNFA